MAERLAKTAPGALDTLQFTSGGSTVVDTDLPT